MPRCALYITRLSTVLPSLLRALWSRAGIGQQTLSRGGRVQNRARRGSIGAAWRVGGMRGGGACARCMHAPGTPPLPCPAPTPTPIPRPQLQQQQLTTEQQVVANRPEADSWTVATALARSPPPDRAMR